jgi:hypothetical protein
MQLCKARNILLQQRLCMLDTVAAVARSVFFFDPFIEVQDHMVCAVADCMRDQLQPCPVGEFEFGIGLFGIGFRARPVETAPFS